MSLKELIDTFCETQTIDFLKIDAEGAEEEIVRGADLKKHRPRIIVVEATQPLSQEPAWTELEPVITGQGYDFVWFDGLNRFYLRDEDRWRRRYFDLPPCVFDNFRTSRVDYLLNKLAESSRALLLSSESYVNLQSSFSTRIDELTQAHEAMDAAISYLNAKVSESWNELGAARLARDELLERARNLPELSGRLCGDFAGTKGLFAGKARRAFEIAVRDLHARINGLVEHTGAAADRAP